MDLFSRKISGLGSGIKQQDDGQPVADGRAAVRAAMINLADAGAHPCGMRRRDLKTANHVVAQPCDSG
jgi:hypothetical protein